MPLSSLFCCRRFSRSLGAISLLLFFLAPAIGKAAPEVPPASPVGVCSAMVYDLDHDATLFEQNADEPIPPASLTKILSMYLALDHISEGHAQAETPVTISPAAAATGGSRMGLTRDETVPLGRLLLGMAVSSGNDASHAVAEFVGGSVPAFVNMMNVRARELGMNDSLFLNPHGLPAAGQRTTARDMLTLARAYLKSHPDALELHNTRLLTHAGQTTWNKNPLLGQYPGADGLKTGWIRASGYNMVFTASRNGRRLLAVIMGAPDMYARGAEACRLLDDEINFADYDANNDGIVDFVYVFHAGKGATTGGSTKTDIWPHAFTLTSAIGAPITLDGVSINRYATSCEVGNQSMQLAGVGMFCHEFSHVLGLPDLYDTANNGTATKVFSPGSFSNMDAGNYNNNLHTPPMFSSYEQYALEWMKPTELTGGGKFTLLPLTARPFAYKVNTRNTPTEYYLLEARAPYSWDEYLEGFGLLVWHIDYVARVWENNQVNTQAAHQYIDIVEADDVQTSTSRSGDTFPGSEGIHELYSNTSPAFVAWDRSGLGIELSYIQSYPDGTVSFVAEGNNDMEAELASVSPRAFDVDGTSAKLYWPAVEGADGYMVSVFDMAASTDSYYGGYVKGWYFNDVRKANNAEVDGLEPGKNYGVMVYAYNDVNASRMAQPITFTTHGETFAESAPGIHAYQGDEGGNVDLNWDAVADATHYELTVATRAAGETKESVKAGFDNSTLPEGWKTSGRYETRDKYAGEAVPSLNLKLSGDYLKTAVFDRDIKSISFHNTITFSEDAAEIEVFGVDAEGRTEYLGKVVDFDKNGADHTFDFPAGYKQAILRLDTRVSGLSVYLDDVEVALQDGPTDTPVSGYSARKVEDTALSVTGLEPNTEYVAYVRPMKGEDAGKSSKAIYFVPSKASLGVDGIVADGDSQAVADVRLENGVLSANGEMMTIYSADGRLVGKGVAFSLPARGLYIVRVGEAAKKICW